METTKSARAESFDMKLEVVVLGVSDVDLAKAFYAVRVAALSEYVGRWVAAEAYARMLSGDAQFRVVLPM